MRGYVILKQTYSELLRLVHPRVVAPVKLNGRTVERQTLASIWGFMGLYLTVFVVVGVLWTTLQMYIWAVLLEQEDQRLRLALRNAAILFIANPGFTIVLLVLLVAVAVVSWLLMLPWLLITLAFFAVVCNKAVMHLLGPFRERMREEGEEPSE